MLDCGCQASSTVPLLFPGRPVMHRLLPDPLRQLLRSPPHMVLCKSVRLLLQQQATVLCLLTGRGLHQRCA